MAREKGMGNLQLEKSGRWTMRVGIKGKRYSRSTRTTDRKKAEAMLQRFLAPLGLGERRLPLADVWNEYVKSPNRNDLAATTLASKHGVWMHFARWMEANHLEVGDLGDVTADAIAEYLACMRADYSATSYNNRVCVLREMFRILATKAGIANDPWEGVRLRPDDSHSRRELSLKELKLLITASERHGEEYHRLFLVGIYTGLRLGDCCRLSWKSINMDAGIIQLIPSKTKRHAHGKPVTIPIHPELAKSLALISEEKRGDFVMPSLAEDYRVAKWRVSQRIGAIFKDAGITMSIYLEGRSRRTPEASFHSLRHSFVSLAANAGVPLHIVQSIVGHESTAMTRHYYHESVDCLRAAVAAIPSIN